VVAEYRGIQWMRFPYAIPNTHDPR
jgi:hypothetical protein